MKRSRVLIALLILCAALTAASASFSIAWYASSTHLLVEQIVIQIDDERELLLATEKEGEYKERLETKDLNAVGAFTPVTTAFQSTWLGQEDMPKFYDMSHPHNTEDDPRLIEGQKDGYFSQELYIKSDDDVIVGIDTEKSYFVPDKAKNMIAAKAIATKKGYAEGSADYDAYVEFTYERLNLIHQAGRISLLVDDQYLVYDPVANEEGPVYFAGVLDNDIDHEYDTFVRSSDLNAYEVCYGELVGGMTRAELPYREPGSEKKEVAEYNAFEADHNPNAYILDVETAKENFATEPRLTKKELGPTVQMPSFHFDLNAFQPKRIVVSFYLEGWDLDSVNYLMGASFDLNLSFRIIREK